MIDDEKVASDAPRRSLFLVMERFAIGLFCNSNFGVLLTTFLVIKVLSSVLRPAQSIFRAEFLGSKSQSFLLSVLPSSPFSRSPSFSSFVSSFSSPSFFYSFTILPPPPLLTPSPPPSPPLPPPRLLLEGILRSLLLLHQSSKTNSTSAIHGPKIRGKKPVGHYGRK